MRQEQNEIASLYDKKLTADSRPRKTEVTDDLPVTAVGKVDMKALERSAEEGK